MFVCILHMDVTSCGKHSTVKEWLVLSFLEVSLALVNVFNFIFAFFDVIQGEVVVYTALCMKTFAHILLYESKVSLVCSLVAILEVYQQKYYTGTKYY